MKQIINYTLFITVVMLLIQSTSFATCTGDNTFTGATSPDWGTASNWSAGCVPGVGDITGVITIQSDCVVSSGDTYTFSSGKLIIECGITFTNNGTATIVNVEGTGTYVDDLITVNGIISPEPTTFVYGTQTYSTVEIGTQCWMAENLNVGDMIKIENGGTNADGEQTDNGTIEKYCYNDNASSECGTYGGLYQWDEMMQYVTTESTQGVCPTGWHLPSDTEWKTMEMQLGMTEEEADDIDWRGTNEGSKMAGNAALWIGGDLENNSEFGDSGLAVLPGGRRRTNGSFAVQGKLATLWSSTESSSSAWTRALRYLYAGVYRNPNNKAFGFSVRCVRDD
ncbi:MAG: hypothetical protein GY751_18310 [Bacteroidetes bacterium]|nr:hypothetical protein [Bacteroidota bacterium]